ncbi:hypothetical protein FB45DRAFT_1064243 [Roridomyces roridus]|uniref:Secreted protein n=1 Tax=Roridomyces roridus TaxID=1738132 RepID=A0AAD7FEU4_9AGAR|nr:hypothetical protein FB45DRAFT_1064243 [Roridomyces roridus]
MEIPIVIFLCCVLRLLQILADLPSHPGALPQPFPCSHFPVALGPRPSNRLGSFGLHGLVDERRTSWALHRFVPHSRKGTVASPQLLFCVLSSSGFLRVPWRPVAALTSPGQLQTRGHYDDGGVPAHLPLSPNAERGAESSFIAGSALFPRWFLSGGHALILTEPSRWFSLRARLVMGENRALSRSGVSIHGVVPGGHVLIITEPSPVFLVLAAIAAPPGAPRVMAVDPCAWVTRVCSGGAEYADPRACCNAVQRHRAFSL